MADPIVVETEFNTYHPKTDDDRFLKDSVAASMVEVP